MDFMRYEKECRVGVTFEEMDDILQGNGFEKYRQRISELGYNQQWLLTDYLCERMVTKATADEMCLGRYREISGWVDNVLDMLSAVDEKGILSEKAFCFINKNELLVKVVSNIKTEQYLVLCDRFLEKPGA